MEGKLAAAEKQRADLDANNRQLREKEERLSNEHAVASKTILNKLAAS